MFLEHKYSFLSDLTFFITIKCTKSYFKIGAKD